jgi:hypothetical protein
MRDVVRVKHASAGAAHRARHLLGRQPAAQQSLRSLDPTEGHRIALQQLSLLAEPLAYEPH